jgi:hypothetical protein
MRIFKHDIFYQFNIAVFGDKHSMTEKMLNRLIILLLVAALAAVLVSPVLAADTISTPDSTDQTGLTALTVPQENIQGFNQDSHAAIPAPYALTEVKGLTIDPTLVNATPYWVYLAAGKKEQQALTDYIRNSDIPQKKKTEWIGFLQATWKKYSLKFIRKGSSATITLAKPQKEYSLTKKEAATFAEIDDQITADMEQTASQGIHPMFYQAQHTDFMTAALTTENYIPDNLKNIAIAAAPKPDDWYSNDDAGKLLHSLNHGYFVLGPTNGVGLASQNTGTYAIAAKADYLTKNYNDAFTSLGYSSHFMGDLGQPFHTPNPILLARADWLFYDIGPFPGNLATKIRHYEIFHNGYESSVDDYWNNPLPNYKNSLSYYADADNGATVIVDPATSATLHADASSAEIIPLFYLCEWHYFFNKNFDYMSDPVIAGITIDRVQASVENIRGLVRYMTGQQAPTPPAIVPLCKAGDAFDTSRYPQNTPQSIPMTVTCNWDGNGQVYLSGNSSELTGTYADDGFTVDTPKGIQFDAAEHWAHQHPPLNITTGMNTGSNQLTIIVRNWNGLSMSYGSSTSIGVDQTPWIIEVNDPSLITAARSMTVKTALFVPNNTSVINNFPATTTAVLINSTIQNG